MALSIDSGFGASTDLSVSGSFDGGSLDSQSQTQLLQSISQLEAMLRELFAAVKADTSNDASSGFGGNGTAGGGFDPSAFTVPDLGSSPQVLSVQPGDTVDAQSSAPAASPASISTSGSTSGTTSGSSSDFGGSTLGPGFPPQLEPYRSDIESASEQTGVPANLIAAQIWQESRGQADATSTNVNGLTDTGLMQVDPATFASLQQEHPALQGKSLSDPATNILAGAYYMSDMAKQFGGNWDDALRAYNSGPGEVNPNNLSDVTLGDPDYVNEVTQYASTIEDGGQLPA